MKILRLSALILIGFLFLFLIPRTPVDFAQSVAPPSIIITEIAAFEPADTEWIEIYNRTTEPIDLASWKFFEEKTNHSLSLVNGVSVLNPDQYAIIANKADAFVQKYPNYTGALFDSSWGTLKEAGEELGIKNSQGNFSEFFTYPDFSELRASFNKDAVSIERVGAGLNPQAADTWVLSPLGHSMGAPYAQGNETIPEENIANETSAEETPAVENSQDEEQPTAAAAAAAVETQENLVAEEPAATREPPVAQNLTATQELVATQEPASTQEPPAAQNPNTAPVAQQQPIIQPTPNSPPTAVIQIQSGELQAQEKTTLNFDGRESFDPDGDPLTFFWDMGDGATSSSANPGPHKYGEPGSYTVRLIVTDPSGATNEAREYVQVFKKTETARNSVPAGAAAPAAQKQPAAQNTEKTAQKSSNSGAKTSAKNGQTAAIQPSFLIDPNDLPSGAFEIRAYIIFGAPEETAQTTDTSKTSKTSKTKTTAKTGQTAKTQPAAQKSKKTAFIDGDLSNSIRVTEIFPRPAGDEEEWIEIQNTGRELVNLGNWGLADAAKKESPYLISDEVTLEPGEYFIFKKSATKISLNNDKDDVILTDFNGDIVDAVFYEKAQAGSSYALVSLLGATNIKSPQANSNTAYASEDSSEIKWQWVASPTPNAPNQTYEKISGTVTRLLAGGDGGESLLEIRTSAGESKTIKFPDEQLDPTIAETVLTQGAEVYLEAEQKKDGAYGLGRINEVRPAPNAEEKTSAFPRWIIVALIAAAFAINGFIIFLIVKKRGTRDTEQSTEDS